MGSPSVDSITLTTQGCNSLRICNPSTQLRICNIIFHRAMAKIAEAVGFFYLCFILLIVGYFLLKALFEFALKLLSPKEVDVKVNLNPMLPRKSMILADQLMNLVENRKAFYKNLKVTEKVIIFPLEIWIFLFAKIYLFLMTYYVLFCIKYLHLEEEEIFPPFNVKAK